MRSEQIIMKSLPEEEVVGEGLDPADEIPQCNSRTRVDGGVAGAVGAGLDPTEERHRAMARRLAKQLTAYAAHRREISLS